MEVSESSLQGACNIREDREVSLPGKSAGTIEQEAGVYGSRGGGGDYRGP